MVPDDLDARLEANLEELASTPTVAAFEQEQRERRRMGKAILALLVLAIIIGYILTGIVANNVGRTAARQEVLDSTVASLVQANQVREAKGLPAIPVDEVVAQLNDQGIVQAVTSAVLSQIEGDPRFRGSNGVDGAPGANGQPGSAGTNGVNGANGASGTNGEPGPAGAQGVEGPPGAQGAQGPEGPQGEPGPQGNAPNSFTIDGQTCTRDADNSGNYTCTIGP